MMEPCRRLEAHVPQINGIEDICNAIVLLCKVPEPYLSRTPPPKGYEAFRAALDQTNEQGAKS
jgi:hypothetical protein